MSGECEYCGSHTMECECRNSVDIFYKNLYDKLHSSLKYTIDEINEEIQSIKEHSEYMEDPIDIACATGQMNAYEHCKNFIQETMNDEIWQPI